jgi:hypothetical protein
MTVRNSGGTASTSHTPFAEQVKRAPSADGARNRDVRAQVHRVAMSRPQQLGEDRGQEPVDGAVEEVGRGCGRGSCPRPTATLCPWLARMRVPVPSTANRCLSLPATTASSSALVRRST